MDEGPHTVLHGDAHPGNTYFRDGRAGLLDWQVVRRGHPARDMQTEATSLEGLNRAVAAIEDLETVATLRQAFADS